LPGNEIKKRFNHEGHEEHEEGQKIIPAGGPKHAFWDESVGWVEATKPNITAQPAKPLNYDDRSYVMICGFEISHFDFIIF